MLHAYLGGDRIVAAQASGDNLCDPASRRTFSKHLYDVKTGGAGGQIHYDIVHWIFSKRARFVLISHSNDETSPMHCAREQCRVHYLRRNASALSSTNIALYFVTRQSMAPVANYETKQ